MTQFVVEKVMTFCTSEQVMAKVNSLGMVDTVPINT